MAKYRCTVCEYIYDEETEGIKWEDLPDDWVCPVCESGKTDFVREEETAAQGDGARPSPADTESFVRTSDDLELHMADIHRMAETGESVTEPMRTRKAVVSWDDILILGAQLARIPLDHDAPVRTETVIGPAARKPMVIDIPLYVSHMSFGALSREAKIALARGSAAVRTATCSGEGGILPDERENAYRYIFEYVPNRYSVTDENLREADAIEIKIGQSTKPGMGGHLPGRKVTKEIAAIRGFPEGEDILSPSRFSDITDRESLKAKVGELRRRSGGRPIGIKFAAGHIEADMEVAVYAGPDFITIDGRPGGTGASPKYIKAATSVPTVYALYRARRYLNERKIKNISLVITGGLRVSSDFAKALALGADAIALATASMIAIGCQQYRVCHQGTCPKGIATHDPDLRARLDVEQAARGLENFFRVSAEELKTFARLTGHDDVHGLSLDDVCTTSAELAERTCLKPAWDSGSGNSK